MLCSEYNTKYFAFVYWTGKENYGNVMVKKILYKVTLEKQINAKMNKQTNKTKWPQA